MSDTSTDKRELRLELTLNAPREKLWRCWTEMPLLDQWFCPKPWRAEFSELDLRVGGVNRCVMKGPGGESHESNGVYLEIIPGRKLVFTDAYEQDWAPVEEPFFTGIIEFADTGAGKTRYTAIARHWTADACRRHAEMGFHDGWTAAARQLESLAATLEDAA